MWGKLSNLNINKFLGRDGKGSLRERVTNNERKITLLKNIIKGPKAIDEKYKGIGKSPIEPLEDIHTALDDLLEVIRADQKLADEKAEYERLKRERLKREKEKEKLQKERWEGIKNISKKILAPFQGIWNKIWGFISTILLGNVVLKIVNWIGNKENQGKLNNIFRFFKDWWPVMLASYLLFGNAFGKMAVGLVAVVAKFTLKLVTFLIPKLVAAIAKIKAIKIGQMLGGLRGLGNIKSLPGLFSLGAGAFEGGGLVQQYNNGGMVLPPLMGDGKPMEGLPFGLGGGGGGTNALTEQAKVKTRDSAILDFLSGDDGKLRRELEDGAQRFKQGGFVSGPGGVDKVPARLTAGEFVMSKGAVDKFGTDFMEGINASGGGTNVPTIVDNSRYYYGGGKVSLPSFFVKKDVVQNFQGGGEVQSKWTAKNIDFSPTNLQVKKINPPLSPMSNVMVMPGNDGQGERTPKLDTQGNKIPEFDAETFISPEKIKTLGISI